jgi:hypothetical protein
MDTSVSPWWPGAKPKLVTNFKFQRGGTQKRMIELPAAEAADGGRGLHSPTSQLNLSRFGP